jgi:hypothetical protein
MREDRIEIDQRRSRHREAPAIGKDVNLARGISGNLDVEYARDGLEIGDDTLGN